MIVLYTADIRPLAENFAALADTLDAPRRARTLAFGPTGNGLRCLAGGLLMRYALGADGAGRICRDANGKPYLPAGRPFNLSHAGDYAILAVADGAVGADVERIREMNYDRFARRCFHPDEYAYWRASEEPAACFFTLWTLKESYLKAEGTGLATATHRDCILPAGENGARMHGNAAYQFRRYALFPGYCAAVCSLDGDFPETAVAVTF